MSWGVWEGRFRGVAVVGQVLAAGGGAAEAMLASRQQHKPQEGALRLDPASPPLWAALGCASPSPATREYALSRALSLDPRAAVAWAALGREYMRAGERGLAAKCLTSARGQEPTCGPAWEGMGSLAALSDTGAAERLDVYEHAAGLGGGFEALLGFAEGALDAGHGHEGRVYVAASRAAAVQPLDAAAQNARGLACEARGALDAAVAAFSTAADILSSSPDAPDQHDDIGGPITQSTYLAEDGEVGDPPATVPLGTTVHINLARALRLAGRYAEAATLYDRLDRRGELQGYAEELCSFALALDQQGQVDDAVRVLDGVIYDEEASPQVRFAAVRQRCRMQARCHSPSAAVQALTGLLPTLAEISPPDKAMQNFWLGLLAAAAASGRSSSGALAEARGLMHAWEMSREEAGPQGRAAELVGQLLGLEAAQKALAGNQKQAVRISCRALFACPWALGLRVQAACSAWQAQRGHQAARLCGTIASFRLQLLPCGYGEAPAGSQAYVNILLARLVCTSAACESSQQAEARLRLACHWVHDDPRTLDAPQWLKLRRARSQLP